MGNDVVDKLKKKGFLDIQLHQIQLGLSEGLPVEIYANPAFDWFQMEEIRKGLKAKLDVSCYAKPEIPYEKMRQIRKGLQEGIDLLPYMDWNAGVLKEFRLARLGDIDLSKYIKQGYDAQQLSEIRKALEKGIDLDVHIEPEFRAASIAEIRKGLENGVDVSLYASMDYSWRQMREIRKKMQIIFQDPYSSLPPRSTVGGILSEPVEVHHIVPKNEVKDYVLDLMEKCGLRDYYYERYPHEFSGGQRQRICIARALSVNPKLVVCDEPVSALDVSIQAQIINLLKKLQQDMNLTYLFISHDLSVVKFISDKIGVMYLGSMVEFGTKEDIFSNPLHPYTQALFSAIPYPDPDVKMNRIILKGDIPSPANPPKGCRFHTRCPHAKDICKEVTPEYKDYGNGHCAACHLLD